MTSFELAWSSTLVMMPSQNHDLLLSFRTIFIIPLLHSFNPLYCCTLLLIMLTSCFMITPPAQCECVLISKWKSPCSKLHFQSNNQLLRVEHTHLFQSQKIGLPKMEHRHFFRSVSQLRLKVVIYLVYVRIWMSDWRPLGL